MSASRPTIIIGDVMEDIVTNGAVAISGEINIETDGANDFVVGDTIKKVEAGSYHKEKEYNHT